jgi:bacterioferritin
VPPPRLAAILNEGVRHEYTVVLQYLYHSFVAEDKELAEGLQNAAINEMQHMGWLSEEVAEQGGQPDMSHLPLALSRDAEQNLEADIAVEREVTRAYTSQIPEIEEASVRALVERIRDHEIYHAEQFGNMLTEIEGARAGEPSDEETCSDADAPPAIPSVGSLLDGC